MAVSTCPLARIWGGSGRTTLDPFLCIVFHALSVLLIRVHGWYRLLSKPLLFNSTHSCKVSDHIPLLILPTYLEVVGIQSCSAKVVK